MTDSARFSWTVLLPVKVLARAKSRLAVLAGDRRRELALSLASDTVSAVLACPEVARVVVVTSDPAAGPLLAALGAIIVADEPADQADRRGARGTPHRIDLAPDRRGRRAARRGQRARPGRVRSGRCRRRDDDVRGAARRRVPAAVRRGV